MLVHVAEKLIHLDGLAEETRALLRVPDRQYNTLFFEVMEF